MLSPASWWASLNCSMSLGNSPNLTADAPAVAAATPWPGRTATSMRTLRAPLHHDQTHQQAGAGEREGRH